MLPLKADMKTLVSIDLEIEGIYSQICTQHKQLLETMQGNCLAVEFLNKIKPKLHRVAQELQETPQISVHQFVRNNFKLSIERDLQNPTIFHVSLQQ